MGKQAAALQQQQIEVTLPARCSADEAARLIDECSADLRDTTAAISVPERIEEETRWYMHECFAGRCDEWPEWIAPERMRKALRDLQCAVYLEADSALLRSQLILSGLIAEAAKGHAQRCEQNGWPK